MTGPLTGWFFLTALAPATDLSGLDRNIAREPVYRYSPQYSLLVFGSQAERRLWVVLDGDALYVDKNGSGDLTETGKRMTVSRNVRNPHPAVAEVRTFYERIPRDQLKDRVVPAWLGKSREIWFFLEHYLPRADFHPKRADELDLQRRLARGLIRVGFLFDGEFGQTGQAVCAGRPSEAPVLHFDGPRSLALASGSVFETRQPPLRRGEQNDLNVHLVTPGRGEGAITVWDSAYAAADLHPFADVEFPHRLSARRPIRSRVVLNERC